MVAMVCFIFFMRLFFSFTRVLYSTRAPPLHVSFSLLELLTDYEWSLKTSSMKYDYLQFHKSACTFLLRAKCHIIMEVWLNYTCISFHLITYLVDSCLLILKELRSHAKATLTKIRGITCYWWNCDLEFFFQMKINTDVLGISVLFGLLGDSNQQPIGAGNT